MIINQKTLLEIKPLKPMAEKKYSSYGTSWGLSEGGYDIRLAQNIRLHPFKRFALGSSLEEFTMPNCLIGIVHDKSTLIRQGLLVGNSVIEPGWKGFLTLELIYMGLKPIKLYKGQGIAQVLFHTLEEMSQYTGKYQNQENRPVKAILNG